MEVNGVGVRWGGVLKRPVRLLVCLFGGVSSGRVCRSGGGVYVEKYLVLFYGYVEEKLNVMVV